MNSHFVKSLFIVFIVGVTSIFNCGKKEIDTAQKLADALKKEGVKYQSFEQVETKLRKVNEVIALTGDSLRIEILRIEDEMAYKTAVVAALFRLKFDKDKEDAENKLQDVFYKKPFLVMIKQEPAKGEIKQALNKIFPKKSE
jgi:hypothetical protein